jgi:hypothetical protein
MPEEKPGLDREHRLQDAKGNFRIFGEPAKDHAHYRKNGRVGSWNEKTGRVEYAEPEKPRFKFEK